MILEFCWPFWCLDFSDVARAALQNASSGLLQAIWSVSWLMRRYALCAESMLTGRVLLPLSVTVSRIRADRQDQRIHPPHDRRRHYTRERRHHIPQRQDGK